VSAVRPGRPRVVLVAALAEDRTIGRDGAIPWHHPEDLRHFRRVTTGTALVMGRRTLDSVLAYAGRLLPGRPHLVLTRDPAALAPRQPGVTPCGSLEEAVRRAGELGFDTVSVVGGEEVYRLALPVADELVLTLVPEAGGGDTFFPEWDPAEWREVSREPLGALEVVRYVRVR
jgi:dihydrofolate reductase